MNVTNYTLLTQRMVLRFSSLIQTAQNCSANYQTTVVTRAQIYQTKVLSNTHKSIHTLFCRYGSPNTITVMQAKVIGGHSKGIDAAQQFNDTLYRVLTSFSDDSKCLLSNSCTISYQHLTQVSFAYEKHQIMARRRLLIEYTVEVGSACAFDIQHKMVCALLL